MGEEAASWEGEGNKRFTVVKRSLRVAWWCQGAPLLWPQGHVGLGNPVGVGPLLDSH